MCKQTPLSFVRQIIAAVIVARLTYSYFNALTRPTMMGSISAIIKIFTTNFTSEKRKV